jgi:hypothetical protein
VAPTKVGSPTRTVAAAASVAEKRATRPAASSTTASPYERHNVEMDSPKYAHLEDEQRYVIGAVPDGASAPRLIEDRYICDTRLRLRRVTDEGATTLKLGHKVRLDASAPSAVWHTTCYLDEAEFALLGALPAATLRKRRFALGNGSADQFLDALDGLVLLEGNRPFRPAVAAVDVTGDERFSGGALAALDASGAAALLTVARELVA